MAVYHTTSLRLDSNTSLPFHIQLIQNLLITTRRNCPRQLQQSITERTLSMINMCHYTEIPKTFYRNCLDAALKVRDDFRSLSASRHRCGEMTSWFEGLRCIM